MNKLKQKQNDSIKFNKQEDTINIDKQNQKVEIEMELITNVIDILQPQVLISLWNIDKEEKIHLYIPI
ncbi:hypothetical protein A3Q56_00573 [Intoshia linei]|uniref:Uncharacterized protein n=1 Tax=Intoshia linei TaxID=1819745 RepID=A0A177BBP3_9BILA|nr:hypothetical protein A3Q56_00573 [Intoshia linei]